MKINTESAEKEIVKSFLRTNFYGKYRRFIVTTYFSFTYSSIVGSLESYWKKYKKIPDKATLYFLCQNSIIILTQLFLEPLLELPFLEDLIQTFLKKERIKSAIIKGAELLDRPNELVTLLKNALIEIKPSVENIEALFNLQRSFCNTFENKVATLFPTIDAYLDGGVTEKTLNIIMAPTNTGKSTFLINLGVAAILQGLRVFHISLEMSTQAVLERYEMRLTGNTRKELAEKDRRFSLQKLSQLFLGSVYVWEYAPNSISVIVWAKSIEQKVEEVSSPDLIIVDYGDLFKHEKNKDKQEIGKTFTDLRSLAYKYNCPVWSATQTNRGALKKAIVTLADVAEDFEKVRIADNVFTLSATETVEGESPKMLFHAAKVREGIKNWSVLLKTSFNFACFLEYEQSFGIRDKVSFD